MRFCEAPEKCKYPVFSTDKITRKGYCKSHANKYRTDLDRRSIINKAMAKQERLNTKIRSLSDNDGNLDMVVKFMIKGELQEWFNYHMSINEKRCENCKTSLRHYNRLDWYGSQHHIIEKHLCPSVATNYDNHMVLGKWCCHGQFHSSYMNAQKMLCFPLAVERFQLFKDKIALNEVKNIPDCFLFETLINI